MKPIKTGNLLYVIKPAHVSWAFVLLICILPELMAQKRDYSDMKHEKRHKLANNLVTGGSYYSAIDHLNTLVRQHPNNERYMMHLADAYFLSRDYKNALTWYGKLYKMQKKTSLAAYRYAQCLKYNARYQEAQEVFKLYGQAKSLDKEAARMKTFAKNEVLSCDWAMKNTDTNRQVEVIHIGDHVNSKYSEFGPVLQNDSTLIFSSLQSDTVIVVDPHDPHPHQVKLLASHREEDGWGPHTALPNVNTTYENNANGTFTADGRWFYFTRCIPEDNNEMICSIYRSEVVNGIFQKAVKMDDRINLKNYTSTQPQAGVVGLGGKNYEVLFFASNRPGGRGGMDIWYATIHNMDGSLKFPANLGNVVNTAGDEITPFYHQGSKALYFSSNYHYGYGGYDVFRAAGTLTKWEKPANLGKPVNTRVDDTYYTLGSDWRSGFVVSNRPEGYHLTSETCCDDIYDVAIQIPLVLTAEAYSLKDTSLRVDAKFVVMERRIEQRPTLFTAENRVSDSTESAMKQTHHSNIFRYFQNHSAISVNPDSLIKPSAHPEAEQESKYYKLSDDRDYIVFGIGKYDTAAYVMRLSDKVHDVAAHVSSDSLTRYDLKEGNTLDILKLKFYLDADSLKPVVAVVKDSLPVLEDEKTLTVTKFIKQVEEHRMNDLKIILNYDFDDEQFIKTHSPSLDSLAFLMKAYPDLKINIEAHTDNKGTDEYNIDLSKRRAKSIVSYLSHKGIDKKRMFSKWFGESQPMVPNANPDGSDNPLNRHYNRRAEITIAEGTLE